MRKGISNNVPHTYIQDGIRYFALCRNCQTTDVHGKKVKAIHFYVFDEYGWCWLQILHTVDKFINQIGYGVFEDRSDRVLAVEDTTWGVRPLIGRLDAWTKDAYDRGYALEVIREGLGLKLEHLTAIMDTNIGGSDDNETHSE